MSISTSRVSVIQENGQVTIPAEIRERLGWKEGDLVAFFETTHGILLAPREALAMEALDQVGQLLKQEGVTLEELIDSGEQIRAELIRERYGLTDNQ